MTELISGLAGFLSPLVISIAKGGNWPRWAKELLAYSVAIAIGILSAWLTGSLEGKDVATAILISLGASQIAYRLIMEPLHLEQKIRDWKEQQ